MFKWGFVGSAGIAVTVGKQVIKNKDFEIGAVYSRDYKHCERFAKRFNAKPYKSYEEMLLDESIDAIYVATPHAFHYQYAKKALEKGIPVICEKTLVLNYESAVELFEIAERNNTYFVEAMWTWFNKTANQVKDWVDQGFIGKPTTMRADFTVPTLYFGRKERLFNPKSGGGSIYDLGVYPITYAYRLFGYPNRIKVTAKIKNGVDIKSKIVFEYDNGPTCILTCGFQKIGGCNVKITGESGLISVPPAFHEARKATLKGTKKITFKDKEDIALYEREFVKASEEIKAGLITSNYVTKQATLDVLKILEEIKSQIGLKYPND